MVTPQNSKWARYWFELNKWYDDLFAESRRYIQWLYAVTFPHTAPAVGRILPSVLFAICSAEQRIHTLYNHPHICVTDMSLVLTLRAVRTADLWAERHQRHHDIKDVATMNQIHKSQNGPVPQPTIHHSEQKYVHLCSEWCVVGCGIRAMWDLWDWSIAREVSKCLTSNWG